MTGSDIVKLRSFNRLVTERIGALDESYLSRGRPLGEARLLFEIGPDGADLRDLRRILRLDSGYLSRLLRSLQGQGLVEVRSEDEDGRLRRVALTPAGRVEFRAYDRLSDELAASWLAPLDPAERARLVAALGEAERLLRISPFAIRPEPPEAPDARACLSAYFEEIAVRFEGGFDPARGGGAADPEMAPPTGLFLVARLDGRPVGCGGLKFGDGVTGEIKRMWTAAEARGRGVARRLLRRLEAEAREHGLAAVRLDTNKSLAEAQAFYRKEGYAEIDRFNDNPYAHHWFEKRL